MLSMGMTMTTKDLGRVMQDPLAVALGCVLCYVVCPLLGLGLGKAFNLPSELLSGLVLVGAINSGKASNLCVYIARGDVALSVLTTTVTTLLGIVATPLLCKALLGAVVPVDAVGITKSSLEVVLGPVLIGMVLNQAAPKVVKKVTPVLPVIGVLSTCILVASSVAEVAPDILKAGMGLQVPVFLLHLISAGFGYFVPKWLGFNEKQSRTMAIETAMKSSAFGFLLAKLHFKDYAARVPSSVSVVWMALVGAVMAVIWRFMPVKEEDAAVAPKTA